MKRYFILFNVVCLFWLQNIWASPNDALSRRIEAVVPASFSGQIVIGDADHMLYSGSFGFADREAELPVTEKTLFDIGSITKTYTATAVLLLAAQEKLRLEMTLSNWFEGLSEITGSITLHQVLSHTSGLPQYSGADEDSCDPVKSEFESIQISGWRRRPWNFLQVTGFCIPILDTARWLALSKKSVARVTRHL